MKPAEPMDQMLPNKSIDHQQIMSFLTATSLFAHVDPALIEALIPEFVYLRYATGQLVLQEGEPGDSLYMVISGQLRVVSHRQDGAEIFLNTIEAGQSVGEIGLLTGERRTATVYAATACELLRLSRIQYDLLGQRSPAAVAAIANAIIARLHQAQLNLALHVSKLFDRLDEPVLRALRAEIELVLFHGGEAIVRQHEPSDALYLVINGRLRVVLEREDGSSQTLDELQRGQTVGEIGILTGSPRSATVYALRDSLLGRLSRDAFDQLLAAYPQAMVRQFAAPVIGRLIEQHGRMARPNNDIATIAVVPVHGQATITSFTAELAAALAQHGPTLHLTSTTIEQALAHPGIAQTPSDAPVSIAIVRWLNEQEVNYRYVIYEADPALSPWTERCLRQADRILLVGDPGNSPELGLIEQSLLSQEGLHSLVERCLVLVHPPQTERPRGTSRWIESRRLVAHYHVHRGSSSDMARLGRLLIGRGIGVVLSGGGAAGFGHIGALRALRETGIPVDLIGGTSQGGLIACQQAMGWDDATILAKNQRAIQHKFDYTFPITALMAGAEMTLVVQEMFGDAQLEDLWLPCFCITTNLSRASMMVHERGPVWKFTRATTSLPGVLPPVISDGDMLVDGGLLNNLPTDVMRARSDCGTVFASDASGPGSLRIPVIPYEASVSGWQVLWRRLNPFAARLKIPTIGQIMMRVAIINDAQHMKAARNLADHYMRLELGHYGMLEFGALEQIIAAGYRSAQGIINSWQSDEQFQAIRQRHHSAE